MNIKRYKLVNLNNGNILVLDGEGNNVEPRNWDQSDYTYKRSSKTLSETRTYSKDLQFTMNGAKFLRDAYFIDDVEAKVQMFEIRFNPNTSIPYEYFIGDFDFSKYKSESTFVSIPFNTGGLASLIKSKASNKFELSRDTDINGNTISELEFDKFEVINRPIFLNSLSKTNEDDSFYSGFRMRYNDDNQYNFYSLPFELVYESDDSFSTVPSGIIERVTAKKVLGSTQLIFEPLQNNRTQLFYYNSDRDKNFEVKINLSLFAKFIRSNNLDDAFTSLALVKFEGGDNPVFNIGVVNGSNGLKTLDNFTELIDISSLAFGTSQQIEYNNIINLTLLKGESLGIFIVGGGRFANTFDFATLDLNFENIKCEISISENSIVKDVPRVAKCLTNKKAGERLTEILTGGLRYKSDFFSSNEFGLTAITSGEKIRGLEKAKISTSLKDFLTNTKVLFNTGYNIEFINGKETIVHEDLRYFFRNETVIKIPEQVNKVKRSSANEFIFSTIKTGFKKPSGDNLYEEVQGLNEFNTINEYITPITVIENELDITSPYRADSEGKELTIRQHQQINPTGDYRTDNDLFNLDLKKSNTDIHQERNYLDDLEDLPKNVFSPDTVTGLRFSPLNILERHSWYINNAFTKFNSKYIRYSSSIGNSELITKKTGEEEKAENGDYQISSLKNPIFVSQWIEFEFPLDFDLLDIVNGKTKVGGNYIPNTYFKVEFINEFNEKEYGYLFELKPNKEGKWKILKAF